VGHKQNYRHFYFFKVLQNTLAESKGSSNILEIGMQYYQNPYFKKYLMGVEK
jgi:hypothetical protein